MARLRRAAPARRRHRGAARERRAHGPRSAQDVSVAVAVAGSLLLTYALLVGALMVARPADTTLRDAARMLPDLLRLVRRLAAARSVPPRRRGRPWAPLRCRAGA